MNWKGHRKERRAWARAQFIRRYGSGLVPMLQAISAARKDIQAPRTMTVAASPEVQRLIAGMKIRLSRVACR